jgi:hypothetical protein
MELHFRETELPFFLDHHLSNVNRLTTSALFSNSCRHWARFRLATDSSIPIRTLHGLPF